MDGYGQFCPVAKASEILTLRWMPLVVRELLSGSRRFNEIHRGVPKMSRSLLVKRLDQLEEEKLVERRVVGDDDHPEYHLTPAGEKLGPIIKQLGVWGKQWIQREVSEDELDARLLMWDVHRRINEDQLPREQVVVHLHFPDAAEDARNFWLLLEKDSVDLCLEEPAQEPALYVRSDLETFTKAWLGDIGLRRAFRNDTIEVRGRPDLRKEFPEWLGLNMFAEFGRKRAEAAVNQ